MRVADADEATELPAVLAHYRYAEDLDFLAYAVIASDVAGLEESHAARRRCAHQGAAARAAVRAGDLVCCQVRDGSVIAGPALTRTRVAPRAR